MGYGENDSCRRIPALEKGRIPSQIEFGPGEKRVLRFEDEPYKGSYMAADGTIAG